MSRVLTLAQPSSRPDREAQSTASLIAFPAAERREEPAERFDRLSEFDYDSLGQFVVLVAVMSLFATAATRLF